MKRLLAITALASGVLLLLVPRYILPACEYEGYAHMHCSDTARAEYIIGIALMVVGASAFFTKSSKLQFLEAVAATILYGVSYWLPDTIGYCQNPRMPCNYGMVPGIRFIAVVGILVMIGVMAGLAKKLRTKGIA
jgi:Domain of unknown function (DUF4418)